MERYSAIIDRNNDYVYDDFEDFIGDVIYQLEVQGNMDTSDAQGFLMLPKREVICQNRFEQSDCTPIDAKNLAKELLYSNY